MVVAVPFADRTGHPHVRQEIHFQPIRAVSFAGLAPSASHVEAESPRFVAAQFRLGQLSEQIADVIKHLDVGAGIRPRRTPDRRLVDSNQLVQVLESFDAPVSPRLAQSSIQVAAQCLDQDVIDQRALAGPGNAGHADKHPSGDLDIDLLEIVVRRSQDAEELLRRSLDGAAALQCVC